MNYKTSIAVLRQMSDWVGSAEDVVGIDVMMTPIVPLIFSLMLLVVLMNFPAPLPVSDLALHYHHYLK